MAKRQVSVLDAVKPDSYGVLLTELGQRVSLQLANLRNEVDRLTAQVERLENEKQQLVAELAAEMRKRPSSN